MSDDVVEQLKEHARSIDAASVRVDLEDVFEADTVLIDPPAPQGDVPDRREGRWFGGSRVVWIAAACLLLIAAISGVVFASLGEERSEVKIAGEDDQETDLGGWSEMPLPPLEPRGDSLTVWTGTELLVIGGHIEECARPDDDCNAVGFADAVALNPETRSWRRLADPPIAITRATAAVHGDRVLIHVGDRMNTREHLESVGTGEIVEDDLRDLAAAGAGGGNTLAYDLNIDSWVTLSHAPFGLAHQVDDSLVVVEEAVAPAPDSYWFYLPVEDRWEELPPDPFGSDRGLLPDSPDSAGYPDGSDQVYFVRQHEVVDDALVLVVSKIDENTQGDRGPYAMAILRPEVGEWEVIPNIPADLTATTWHALDLQGVDGKLTMREMDARVVNGWALDTDSLQWTAIPPPPEFDDLGLDETFQWVEGTRGWNVRRAQLVNLYSDRTVTIPPQLIGETIGGTAAFTDTSIFLIGWPESGEPFAFHYNLPPL